MLGGLTVLGLLGLYVLWFVETRVVVEDGILAATGQSLWSRGHKAYSCRDIRSAVAATKGMDPAQAAAYDVVLRLADTQPLELGFFIHDKDQAEWLAAAIQKAVDDQR